MEFTDGLGYDIRVPPSFGPGGFDQWRSRMEFFLRANDIEDWFALMEGFEAPKNKKGKPLDKKNWTEEQAIRFEANEKVIKLLSSLIPKSLLCEIGEYEDAKDLWSKLGKLHEESTSIQVEVELEKEENSPAQELEEEDVERCSILELEAPTPRIEGEAKGTSPEDEQFSTSTSNSERENVLSPSEQEEVSTSAANEESTTEGGNISSSCRNKLHIICFVCGEAGHYKSQCPKRLKKAQTEPKAKKVGALIRRGKEHIMCFSCRQYGHYRNQCPWGRHPRKNLVESSSSGGAPKVKPKVSPLFNAISKINKKMHARSLLAVTNETHANNNSYYCLGAKHTKLSKDHLRPTLSKNRKDDTNLGENPKKNRHMPKKKKKFQEINGHVQFDELQLENQFLRSKLDKLEKTLKELKKKIKGSKVLDLGNGKRQNLSKDKKGLRYKPESKKDKPSYHSVPYDYGTKSRSRKIKVTREAIPRVNLDESIVAKASKKPRRAIRKVSREVIPSEYLVNPRSSNRFWVPKSVIPSH